MPLDFDFSQSDPFDLEHLVQTLSTIGGANVTQLRGTKVLMLAVLENAIQSYLKGDARARLEVELWFGTESLSSPFSFGVVCETLGLEPDCVRTTVERIAGYPPSSRNRRRARPNART